MAAKRVLITDNLSPVGLKVLEEADGVEVDVRSGLSPEEVRKALKESDAIIIRSGTTLTAELLEGQERLGAIVRAGVGVNNIDLDAASKAGVVVMNTPGGNTVSTAEHTIAMMLAMCRNIGPAAASMKAGQWDRKKFTGTQVAGKTIAVIGLGRIGQEVAKRCNAMEMTVLGFDPLLSEDRAAALGIKLFRDIDDLIDQCDFLSVHTPLNDATRGLINADRLSRMKPGARLINCARGGIIDEADLAAALESGHIAGAALDVYSQEPPEDRTLADHPKVLAVPHLGASTEEAQEGVALEAAEIITAFLQRGEIRHAVNMTAVSAKEMETVRPYLNLAYRLGLLLSQAHCGPVKGVKLLCRGEAADKPTKLIGSAFTSGLMSGSMEESVHIINAEMTARDRGIEVAVTTSREPGDFATLVQATLETENGDVAAAGTMFGEYLRLVRLYGFQLDAYLDGLTLIYRHKDVPGVIGAVGSVLGKAEVNISHMAVGRASDSPGGDAIGVLNLDNRPDAAVLEELENHPDITQACVIELPPADAPLPWLGG